MGLENSVNGQQSVTIATKQVVNSFQCIPFTDAVSPTGGIEAIFVGGFLSKLMTDPQSTNKQLCEAGCDAGHVLMRHQSDTIATNYQLLEPPVQSEFNARPVYESKADRDNQPLQMKQDDDVAVDSWADTRLASIDRDLSGLEFAELNVMTEVTEDRTC